MFATRRDVFAAGDEVSVSVTDLTAISAANFTWGGDGDGDGDCDGDGDNDGDGDGRRSKVRDALCA